jgi:hypothetical protein
MSRIEGIPCSSTARRSPSRIARASKSGVQPGSGAGAAERAVGTAPILAYGPRRSAAPFGAVGAKWRGRR